MFFGGGNRMNQNVDNNKYYKILGVDKNANEKDIKKAYRRLAVVHHPDKGGDPEKFKEVTKAFETLSDPNKRKNYDQFGEEGENMNGHPGDIFGQMFGMNKQNKRKKGENIKYDINISLKEIYNGKIENITINRRSIDMDSIFQCHACNGTGMEVKTVRMGPMIQQIQQPCPKCGGQGTKCDTKHIKENIKISIPKGVYNNHKIVMYEKGHDSIDGDPGDLIVTIKQIDDDNITRKGYDLFINKDISLLEALKGFKIELDTFDDRKILITSDKVIKPLLKKESSWCNKMCSISLEPFAKGRVSDKDKIVDLIENGQLKDENIVGFIIKGSETYFYKNSLDEIKDNMKYGNDIFYYKKTINNNIYCVEEEGMPYMDSPMIKGDLYISFNIIFPDEISIDEETLIKGGFNNRINKKIDNEIESEMEVYELIKKDPSSSYNKYKENVKKDEYREEENTQPEGVQQCSQQ